MRSKDCLFRTIALGVLLAVSGCSAAEDPPGSSAGSGGLPPWPAAAGSSGAGTGGLSDGAGASAGGENWMAGTGGSGGAAGSSGTGGASGAAGGSPVQPPDAGTLDAGAGGTDPVQPPDAGATDAGAGGSNGSAEAYPCDGDTSGYDAVVEGSGGAWVARRGGNEVYSGSNMQEAIQAGIDSLTAGRSSKQKVLVQGSGSISANTRVSVASYTVLNVCGTIDVTGTGSGDRAPIYARGRTDIEIPNATITGAPVYGLFFRDVENLHLGRIELRVSSGLGIRIDNHGRADRSDKVSNIRIDHVYVEGTGTHGVETYGVDNLTIGTVIARQVGDSGLLLNDTTNAEIGLVDAVDAGTGTGYAAFRMANRNGRIDDGYPTNIHVAEVVARGGGRGIFCVSESGGAVIDRINIADTGNNSILIENCYNVTIAAESGSVTGGGDIRLAARTEFPNSSDITIQNLTVTNTAINENPCAVNSIFVNNTLVNAQSNVCN